MTELHLEFEPPQPDPSGDQWFMPPFDAIEHLDIALVRARAEWVQPFKGGKQVQLGAGRKLIQGFDNIDFPGWDAHSDDHTKWRLPYADETVSEFVSYHTLDHLEPWAVVRVLREIQRCLLVGGTFVNIVPHGDSQLAKECLFHRSRFMVDTFRNIFSERQYDHRADGVPAQGGDWEFSIGQNFIYGITERNTVLVTQLVRQ